MRFLLIVLAFILSVVNTQAQNLKTYEGSFPHTIDLISGSSIASDEIVKYTYFVDENTEERVYHGPFTLSSESQNKIVKGNFKNNKQDGEWTYKQGHTIKIDRHRTARWEYDVTVNFKDGVLHGPLHYVSLYDTDGNGTEDKEVIYDFTIDNGKIVGNFSIGDNFKGQFDDKGNPIGKWREEGKDFTTIYEFTPGSSTFETKRIDERTGDITRTTVPLNEAPVDIYYILNHLKIHNFFLRDTTGLPAKSDEDDDRIYSVVTTFAEIQIPLDKYIKEHRQVKGLGRCTVRVTVNKDGSATDPVIVRSVSRELDTEAIRLINEMAATYGKELFTPGTIHGKPVNSHVTLNISFR